MQGQQLAARYGVRHVHGNHRVQSAYLNADRCILRAIAGNERAAGNRAGVLRKNVKVQTAGADSNGVAGRVGYRDVQRYARTGQRTHHLRRRRQGCGGTVRRIAVDQECVSYAAFDAIRGRVLNDGVRITGKARNHRRASPAVELHAGDDAE